MAPSWKGAGDPLTPVSPDLFLWHGTRIAFERKDGAGTAGALTITNRGVEKLQLSRTPAS